MNDSNDQPSNAVLVDMDCKQNLECTIMRRISDWQVCTDCFCILLFLVVTLLTITNLKMKPGCSNHRIRLLGSMFFFQVNMSPNMPYFPQEPRRSIRFHRLLFNLFNILGVTTPLGKPINKW